MQRLREYEIPIAVRQQRGMLMTKQELEKKYEELRREINEMLENGLEMTDKKVLKLAKEMDETLNQLLEK